MASRPYHILISISNLYCCSVYDSWPRGGRPLVALPCALSTGVSPPTPRKWRRRKGISRAATRQYRVWSSGARPRGRRLTSTDLGWVGRGNPLPATNYGEARAVVGSCTGTPGLLLADVTTCCVFTKPRANCSLHILQQAIFIFIGCRLPE